MKRRYKVAMLIGAVIVAGGLFVIVQPGPSYDIQKVHPRLRALQQPFQKVQMYRYADGGSIGMKIVDRNGREERFFIPARLGDNNRYTRVFVGGLLDSVPDVIDVSDPEPTRRMLTCILRDCPHRTPRDDLDLYDLRGYPKDYIRVLYHRCCGHFRDGSGLYIY